MQIVIDIHEDDYQRICETKLPSYGAITYIIHRAFKYIKNGKPLPKGHGRLGDLDALETGMVNGIRAGNYEEGYETFAHIVDMDDCVDYVRYADTIIEADKSESVDK